MRKAAATLALVLLGDTALAQQSAVHTVYLAMMLQKGVPRQMSTEATLDACQRVIEEHAALEERMSGGRGDLRHYAYCQPAVAPASLGPR